MTPETLAEKIEKLPIRMKHELIDFMEFLIEKSNKERKNITPKPGGLKGKIWMADDFDEPLDEFKPYM